MGGGVGFSEGSAVHVEEEGDGHGADAGGRWIFLFVACELAAEAKIDFSHPVQSGVSGPHAGEDLADGAEVLLHLAFLNFFARCCQDARSNSDCEDLEDRDWVVDALEIGGDAKVGAERGPNSPVGSVGTGL